MGQMGFFDIANRYAGLDAKNDPLARIDEVVPLTAFGVGRPLCYHCQQLGKAIWEFSDQGPGFR